MLFTNFYDHNHYKLDARKISVTLFINVSIKWSFVKNRENWVMDEGCEKILRLIFGTFLEVEQPIPNMKNIFLILKIHQNIVFAYKV